MKTSRLFSSLLPAVVLTSALSAQTPSAELPPPGDTEFYSPVPPVVQAPAGKAPSDAIVLFDGSSLDGWESVKNRGQGAPWRIEGDAMVVADNSGDIRTKQAFGDVQLHLEYRINPKITGKGQLRGNSGVFLMGRYEIQVLDSYQSETYVNGQTASIYKQYAPLVNASRAPGEWQTYDIIFTAPRFDSDGKLLKPAYMTVLHNGVVVHHAAELKGPTVYRGQPKYQPHAAKLPIVLQEHKNDASDAVAYRNIWVRELALPEPSNP
jgi:hypothetical protein